MEKLVYLFELDSVRTSEAEIKKGQQALFEEIVLNGNKVVLSFNQLTDSRVFLSLLKDEHTYPCIVDLFRLGALKISLFGNYRTPSQYIQEALRKCNKSDSTFIFSGLPVKASETELLNVIENSLKYTDLSILRERLKKANDSQNKSECERLTFIIRYIDLILHLSREELATNPPLSQIRHSYIDYMDLILAHSDDIIKTIENDHNLLQTYSNAFELLTTIRTNATNDRSKWMEELLTHGKGEDVCIANAIIDLCYNYTIEDSILGISKHYIEENDEDFFSDFLIRFKSYKNGDHIFPTKDTNDAIEHFHSDLPWNTAVHLVKNTRSKKKFSANKIENILKHTDTYEKPISSSVYEDNYETEKRRWKIKISFSILRQLAVTAIYIVLSYISDLLMGSFESLVESVHILDGIWFDIIFSFLIFGIISSIVSEITHLPDLLESLKNIGNSLIDTINLFKSKRNIAYKNKNQL